MKIKTWQIELSVATLVMLAQLFIAAWLTNHFDWRELIGTAAVLVLFAHGQVSDRLSEQEAERVKQGAEPHVHCHRMEKRYFMGKEVLWMLYFALIGAWSAIAGTLLLFLYRPWRSWYRRRRPLDRDSKKQP